MANKKTVEEQVAELTQEQQDRIIKYGKIGLILILAIGIPFLILVFSGIWVMVNPPLGFDYNNYDTLYLGFKTTVVIGLLLISGVFAFIKIKCPYYSDAKWRYINKLRKGK